jgi:hypothetical protein
MSLRLTTTNENSEQGHEIATTCKQEVKQEAQVSQ